MQNKKKNDRRLPGFYIALCCCVLALGAAGYFSERLSVKKASTVAENVEIPTTAPIAETISTIEPLPAPEDVSVFSEDNPPEILVPQELIPTEPPLTEEDYTSDNPDIDEVNASVNTEESFTVPVNGEIAKEYSNTPEFNNVMGDWRTHNGVDIKADEGSEIRCAADGEIKSIANTVYGCELTISHSNGYETIYSQLTPSDEITEGKNVRSGDVIGHIAVPLNETITEAHLHFGVKKDGMFIDPKSMLGL
ncbi:MAG: M23 family metallopeptidase [bacterium]|nr:M23 family metallopeptidase [bacterium]